MRLGHLLTVTLAAIAVIAVADDLTDELSSQWPVMGQNLTNSRDQLAETKIGPGNVSSLTVKWAYTAGGDISATPTVAGNAVYAPDWGGNLFAVRNDNGELLWSHQISEYDGVSGAIARVSPTVNGRDLIIGDIQSERATHNGANVMAVDRSSGRLRWITQVETHPAAIISGPAVVFSGIAYVGVSSNEEALANNPAYPCCTFRGSMVALDANTGRILWKTYDMPANSGYTGGAIWQPAAIDPARGLLYVGTGNNYTVPSQVLTCEAANPQQDCTAANDFFDTALALDLKTGAIRWSRKVGTFDAWTVACINTPTAANCPSPHGPDFDLGGSGPNLLPGMVGFGAKSGIYWMLNPDSGAIKWSTPVGPGGTLGGIEWGSATDGRRIYAAIGNNSHQTYTLVPGGQQVSGGSWSALDAATGKIIWQTADPAGAIDPGSVSVANGVVYAGSYAGQMYALDAATGKMLWMFNSGGSVLDGPSIVNGVLYWGSGYRRIAPGIGNNKLFAFTIRNNQKQEDR
jgi:polyvinyl alcohol dehydrogenase (cytochrome)